MAFTDDNRKYINEYVQDLAGGIIHRDAKRLSLSEARVELNVAVGDTVRGEVSVALSGVVHGSVYATGARMSLGVSSFSGEDAPISIPYIFDSTGLDEGDVVKGDIIILSDRGEYVIPYVVSVSHSVIESDQGFVKNLFHFTNLAQSDFDQAADIFYSKSFKSLFINNDRPLYEVYRGFNTPRRLDENVESFLQAVRKKVPVTYSFDSTDFELLIDSNVTKTITITRSTWGYTRLKVAVDGDFISVSRDELLKEDFVDGVCLFHVMIDFEKLHCGKNFGKITFTSMSDETEVFFEVSRGGTGTGIRRRERVKSAYRAELLKTYMNFRIHNISRNAWEKRSEAIVDRLLDMDGNDSEILLYKAHVNLSTHRNNEAKDILDKVRDGGIESADPRVYGYYLYLMCLLDRDEEQIRERCRIIHRLYRDNREYDTLLWMLIYIDEELIKNPADQLVMMRHQREVAGISPLLYLEAYNIFAKDPMLLKGLGSLEIQVINFSVKTGLFNPELTRQIVYLATRQKDYNAILVQCLKALYEKYAADDILNALCLQLMKGNRTDEDAFSWYFIAVSRELRITRLFEFFVFALPRDYAKPLPRIIQLYFRYSKDLDDERAELLYSNLIQFSGGDKQILSDYHDQMESFAIKSISQGKINPQLAIIYDYLKDDPVIVAAMGENIASLAFAHRLYCTNERAKRVVVVSSALKDELCVGLVNGEAIVPIYTRDYRLLWEDDNGVRHICDDDITDEPMLRPLDHVDALDEYGRSIIGINIFFGEMNRHYVSVDSKNCFHVGRIIESDMVCDEYKKEYRHSLLQFYYDNDYMTELDNALAAIDPAGVPADERAELVEFMIRRGMTFEVYELVKTYGYERIASRLMLRLCAALLTDKMLSGEYDRFLLALCRSTFRMGKYDENILKYLMTHLQGTGKNLRDLWKAAVSYDMGEDDIRSLEERILLQMLFTRGFVGEREDIFGSYQRHHGLAILEAAWITNNAFEYLVRDAVMDEDFFMNIISFERNGNELNDLCHLAVIRYYAEERSSGRCLELEEDVKKLIAGCIDEFVSRKIILKDFMAFCDLVPQLSMYQGREFVEYKAMPGNTVTLHYLLEADGDSQGDYRTEVMKGFQNGIYSKSFQLFYGESLQYYITEEADGNTLLTQSLVIEKNDVTMGNYESRYDVLNDMLLCLDMGEAKSLINLMDVYRRRRYVAEHIFTIR